MYDDNSLRTIEYHRDILTDEVRTQSFLLAILNTVKPGDIVLDIGCGTGILSYFACMAGAKQVYAVEQGPIIELAKDICIQNGFEDRVTFISGWSTNIELTQQVDVIITETIGNLGIEEGILGWIVDARKRFLAEAGQIIPCSIEMIFVPVEYPEYDEYIDSWRDEFCSLDLSPVRSLAVNNLLWAKFSSQSFLSEPNSLLSVDLKAISTTDLSGELTFIAQRDGIFNGLGGWFTAELAPGVNVTNAPPLKTPSWNQVFFPLHNPLQVKLGDQLSCHIQIRNNATQWEWQITAIDPSGGKRFTPDNKSQQTSLDGNLFTRKKTSMSDHNPSRTKEADIDLFILQLMDGETPLREIVDQAFVKFPSHFTTSEKAFEYAYQLTEDYSHWREDGLVYQCFFQSSKLK